MRFPRVVGVLQATFALVAAVAGWFGLAAMRSLGPRDVDATILLALTIAIPVGLAGSLLVARGLWLLPSRKGRAYLAAGYAVDFLSFMGLVTVTGAAVPGAPGIAGWIDMATAGLIAIFLAAWWSGHEPSRWLGIATLVASAVSGVMVRLAQTRTPAFSWDDPTTVLFFLGPLLTLVVAAALLPRHDPPPEAPAPDLVLS